MSNKLSVDHDTFQPNVADELRLSVAELNQSIAYLSKMVLQLQRSINEKKGETKKGSKDNIPQTLH